MRLRPRTFRRLTALLVVLMAVTAGLMLVQARGQQLEARRLAGERATGLALLEAGEFEGALQSLRRYVEGADAETLARDGEARLAYARALVRAGGAGSRGIDRAARLLRDLLADPSPHEQPRRAEAARLLMTIEAARADWPELRQLADTTLDARPADAHALRMRRLALEQTGDLEAALQDAQQLNELEPTSLADHIATLRLMARSRLPAEALVRRAIELRDLRHDDPRFLLLLAIAYDNAGQSRQAQACLDEAAGAAPPDDDPAGFVTQLAGLFDSLGQHERALEVYARAVAGGADPDPRLRRRLALRRWHAGQIDLALSELVDAPPAESGAAGPAAGWGAESLQPADVELVATKTILLFEAGRDQDARAGLGWLRSTGRDAAAPPAARRAAGAWQEGIAAGLSPGRSSPRQRLEQLHAAYGRASGWPAEETPGSPFGGEDPTGLLLKWQGDLLAEMIEIDLAVDRWSLASRALPAWTEPHRLIAETQLAAGHLESARRAAAEAARRAQGPRAADEALALRARIAYAAWLEAPSTAGADEAAALAAEHQARRPLHAATLPIHVHLTALRDRAAAGALLRRRLEGGAGDELRLALARVSQATGLDLEEELLEGVAHPEAHLLRALRLADRGAADAAMPLFDAPPSGASGTAAQWALARARFLEQARPADAPAEWQQVADAFEGDAAVQSAILEEAASARADRAFIARTIERLAALTGPGGRRWRLEKARWLLTERSGESAMLAADVLRELIRGNQGPDSIDARLLLAECLVLAGNMDAAAEHLRAAYELNPQRGDVGLRLIAACEQLSRRDEARRLLGRLAAEGVSGPRERLEVAVRLADAGETATAIELLEQASDAGNLEADGRLVLAELLAAAGREPQAEAVFEMLLAETSAPPPGALLSAAVFHAQRGQAARAEAILGRLSAAPGVSDLDRLVIQASFRARTGAADRAAELFAEALAQRPAEPTAWREALAFELGRGNTARALEIAREARQAAALDERLAAAIVEAQALASLPPGASRAQQLEALVEAARPVAEMWQWSGAVSAVAQAAARERDVGTSAPAEAVLERAARQYPHYVALQATLIELYLELELPAEAARVARRLADAALLDAGAQRMASEVAAQAGRHADSERFALRWRRMADAGDPVWPDAAVARSRLLQRQYAGAVEAIAPHVARASTAPEHFAPVLRLAAEAFAADGRYEEALAIVAPHLAREAPWRRLALRLAAERISDVRAAERWLQAVESAASRLATNAAPSSRDASPPIPTSDNPDLAQDAQERLSIAWAWAQLGRRLDDDASLRRARHLLEGLTQDRLRSDPTAWLYLARTAGYEGDREAAMSGYHRVLALDPRRTEAANELALLLLLEGRPAAANEALAWAKAAAEEEPSRAAYQETLGRAYRAMDDRAAARQAFERALRLDDTHLDAMLGLARLLQEEGEHDAAARWFARLEPIYRGAPTPPPHLRDDFEHLQSVFGTASP